MPEFIFSYILDILFGIFLLVKLYELKKAYNEQDELITKKLVSLFCYLIFFAMGTLIFLDIHSVENKEIKATLEKVQKTQDSLKTTIKK